MKFSVLMSIYYKENPAWFDRAMQSIWDDQYLKPDQIVLVKDGHLTKELEEVIDCWREKLGVALLLVPLELNVGLGAALNIGLKHCSHDIVARMDTDDISLPSRFEKQFESLLKNNTIDIIGTYSIGIDEDGKQGLLFSRPVNHDKIVQNLWTCPIIHPSVMFRKNKIVAVGGYDDKMKRRQDYELWFRCAMQGLKFWNIPEPLMMHRISKNTHKKQPVKLAWEQAKIGFKGTTLLKMAWWKRLACFVPFFRSLLPAEMQHFVYKVGRKFDPRLKDNDSTQ